MGEAISAKRNYRTKALLGGYNKLRAEVTTRISTFSRRGELPHGLALNRTRSSDGNALDAGEYLVDGVRVSGLIEEQNQFQILDIDPFECVRTGPWSVA